jgi:nucleoside-triphosphatase
MPKGVKIGITGLPSSGKTNAVLRVIKMLESENKVVGGMITEAIVKRGVRVGFKVMDWMTREEGVMAHVKFDTRVRVGKYGVDLEALERIGVRAILNAIEKADVVVIDEVGKMEVESEKFADAVRKALDVDKHIILTLHKKSRNPLLQDIRRRDDVRILEVTPINRSLLPYKIMKLLGGELL